MSQNTVPIQFGGEWRTPAVSGGNFRFQVAISGSISYEFVRAPGRPNSSATIGFNRSSVNTQEGRSRQGLALEASVKHEFYGICFVQVQATVPALNDAVRSPEERTFMQRLNTIFSTSLGVQAGSFSTFQLTSPNLEDISQAFFLRLSYVTDAQALRRRITRTLQVGDPPALNGSLTIQIRIGLSAQGASGLGARLIRFLPGFVNGLRSAAGTAVTVSEGAVIATTEGAATASTVLGTASVAIPLGFMVMDLLNLALAGARHRGEQRGRCHRFARGYLYRVYFEQDSRFWSRSDRVFQQGVRAAAQDVASSEHGRDDVIRRIYSVTTIYSWQIMRYDHETQTVRLQANGQSQFDTAAFRYGEYIFSLLNP